MQDQTVIMYFNKLEREIQVIALACNQLEKAMGLLNATLHHKKVLEPGDYAAAVDSMKSSVAPDSVSNADKPSNFTQA